MKVVLYENPEEHKHSKQRNSTSIWNNVRSWVELGKGEPELVTNLEQAQERLAKRDVEWIIIHHYDFTTVDTLKAKFSNTRYAVYSNGLLPKERRTPNSIQEAYYENLRKHYDFVLEDQADAILEMMEQK